MGVTRPWGAGWALCRGGAGWLTAARRRRGGSSCYSDRHGGVRSSLRSGPFAGMPASPAAPGPSRDSGSRQRTGHRPRGGAHRGWRGGTVRWGERPEREPLAAPALLPAGAASRAAGRDLRLATRHRPPQPGSGLHQVPSHPAHRHHLETALPGG